MGLSKEQLVFFPTDQADSDNVGAYLTDAAGNLLTSTLLSGKQALDVNIANDTFQIDVGTADKSTFTYGTSVEQPIGGVFQDTSPTLTAGQTGAVRLTSFRAMHNNLRDSSGNELLGQKVMASSIPVVIASDQTPVQVVGNVADNAADSGNPVKIGYRAIVGSPPAAVGASNDRADAISDKFRRIYVNDGADISAKAQNITVGTTAAALPSALSGRRNLMIQNLGAKAIYIGADNTVTSSNGLKVSSNATLEVEIGEDITLWAIGAGAGLDVRLFELA